MKNFNELKKKLLKDIGIRKAYEELAPLYTIIEMATTNAMNGRLTISLK